MSPSGKRIVGFGLAAVLAAGVALGIFFCLRGTRELVPGFPEPEAFDPPLRSVLQQALVAVAGNPQAAERWGKLGMICHAHGLYPEARQAYRKAAAIDARSPRWPHLEGLVCEVLSLPEEGAGAFARALELDRRDVVALCSLGRFHQDRGEDEKARQLYLQALDADRHSVAARVGLGELAARAGVLEMAERSFALVLEDYPRCGPAHAALAQIYDRQGKAEEAAFHRRWSRVAANKVPLPDPLMEEVESQGVSSTARLERGELFGKLGLWREAVESLRAAVELGGGLAEPRYLLGVSLLQAGDVESGLRELEKVTALPGRKVDAWLQIARVRAGRGEMEAAHKAVAEALELDPENADALVARGDLHRQEGKGEAALADYELAIALSPEHAGAFAAKGEILLSRGASREEVEQRPDLRAAESARAQAALAAFERAQELRADFADAYDGAARARMQLWEFAREPAEKEADLQAAIDQFARLVKYFPERKSGHVGLIRALWSARRAKEMLAAIQSAQARWPDDPQFQKY